MIEFPALRQEIAAAERDASSRRTSIANPAHGWLAHIAQADTLAVLGVRILGLEDLARCTAMCSNRPCGRIPLS